MIEFSCFLFGCMLTTVAIFGGLKISEDQKRQECARQHNVFKCEVVTTYEPITNPVSDPPSQ